MELILQNLNTAILGVFASFLVFSFVFWKSKHSKNGSAKKRSPPEAGGAWPIIGHLHLLGGSQPPHKTLANLADKYGPAFTIRLGKYQALIISRWDLAKEAFTTRDLHLLTRPESIVADLMSYDFAMFGFSPYGPYWREIRKLISIELLSARRLDLLKYARVNEIEMSTKELYTFWKEKTNVSSSSSGDVSVDMKEWFADITLNTILRMIAGKRYFGAAVAGAEGKEARRVNKVLKEFFHFAGLFLAADAIPVLKNFDFGGNQKKMKGISKEMDQLVGEWLSDHRQKKKISGKAADKDFMDVMISLLAEAEIAANYDSDTIIISTCINLIAGGSDTTSVTLTWALARIISTPGVLKKVQEELDQHVGKDRRVVDSDISNLVYLQAIVKETLRLYPAGPLGGPRELSEDSTIGGYDIPKGTRLIVNMWKLHRDQNVWDEDSSEFRPERFLTTHKEFDVKGHHFELIPFSAGRRSCPGMYFALLMLHMILANLLQAFDFSTVGGEAVDLSESAGLTNHKVGPLQLILTPRLSADLY